MKVGIIGYGAVGKAVFNTVNKEYETIPYDKYMEEYSDPKRILNTDLLFISLPTPFNINEKKIELKHIYDFVKYLSEENYDGVVVLKSTSPPGTTDFLSNTYTNLNIIFNPEFLRERTAFQDVENQSNIVIGANIKKQKQVDAVNLLIEILSKTVINFNENNISIVEPKVAELAKYAQNVFFANRVAIINIIYDACQQYEIDYNILKEVAFCKEKLIGNNLVDVPGHDGKRGFGGKCLPKDLAGFNSFHENNVTKEIEAYNYALGREME